MLAEYNFERASTIDAERSDNGSLLTYTAYERFENPKSLRLHGYGAGPFVRLRLAALPTGAGVYVVMDGEDIAYVGLAANISARWGRRNYAVIDPRNCYVGGQSTNCRLNNLVYQALTQGQELTLWTHLVQNPRPVEAELIRCLRPPWNIQA
jgi:hypothetical protein